MTARSTLGTRGVLALGLLVLGVAGLLWSGLAAGTAEVVNDDRPEVIPTERGVALVAGLRESGGWSLFGVDITKSKSSVEVRFLTEPGCSGLLRSGDPWPTSFPQCSTPITVVGTVGGLGVTPSGDSMVGVEFEVPRACFDRLERGMAWPNPDRACS